VGRREIACPARRWAAFRVHAPHEVRIFGPAHFIMERKIMLRIKALAEGRASQVVAKRPTGT
jgi:hypothetical protein